MADQDLRKRLATAAFLALDEETLDAIHGRLMNIPGGGKIPLTVKYDFACDDLGILTVDITAKCNLTLQSLKVSLTSDGSQLQLFRSEPAVSEPVKIEPKKETVEAAKPTPKKKAAKKATAKKSAKKKTAAVKAAPRDEPKADPAPEPPSAATDRLVEIGLQNAQLYRDGVIDRIQAKMAGVDVEAIDGVTSDAGVPDLTPDELEALSEASA